MADQQWEGALSPCSQLEGIAGSCTQCHGSFSQPVAPKLQCEHAFHPEESYTKGRQLEAASPTQPAPVQLHCN